MSAGTFERWAVERIKVKSNVRTDFNEESEARHAESLKKDGQLRPLLVLRDGTLIAGERTLRAAKRAGLLQLDVKVVDGEISPAKIKKLQLVENLLRQDLKDAEVYLGVKAFEAENSGMLRKNMAAELHLEPAFVTKIFAVDDLASDAKEAFLNGDFGFTVAYEISRAAPDEQLRLLALRRSGATREKIAAEARKTRKSASGGVRLSKVKIAMPDATVTLQGHDLGMVELVELLADTLKEARKAADQYDVKTWQSMMRDRAKKG